MIACDFATDADLDGEDTNPPSRYAPRQALLSRLESEEEEEKGDTMGAVDVSDGAAAAQRASEDDNDEEEGDGDGGGGDGDVIDVDGAGDREAPNTSALDDAFSWSLGKMRTSAQDWRTGMALWRPLRLRSALLPVRRVLTIAPGPIPAQRQRMLGRQRNTLDTRRRHDGLALLLVSFLLLLQQQGRRATYLCHLASFS